jgi:hypothetical protein
VEVYEPGENQQLGGNGLDKNDIVEAIADIDIDDPEPLWDFYPKDLRIKDKKILDPFMGGGTSLVEASRFGVDSVGVDLNPVAWFVTKRARCWSNRSSKTGQNVRTSKGRCCR